MPTYDDDDDDENEVLPPGINPSAYLQLDQTPGDVVWTYGDVVYSSWNSGNSPREFYHQRTTHNRPPNAHGWTWGSAGQDYLVFNTGNTPSPVTTDRINAFARANPPGDSWCAHREGGSVLPFPYAGQYLAVLVDSSRGRHRLVSETRYDCPHCAWTAATVAAALMPAGTSSLVRIPWAVLCYDTQAIPEFLEAQGIEVVGEPPPENSSTVKDVEAEISSACGNCGLVGHRSPACTRAPKSFKKIGIEIEGRFLDLRTIQRRADDRGMSYAGDSSIGYSPNNEACRAMEFQTKPGSLREACQALVDFYPDETDSTCGMHVHVSFDAVDVTTLNTIPFLNYFKARWEAWGARMNLHPRSHFFRRLRGENSFCRVVSREVDWTRQDRYSQLNFSSWGEHKTVECRMLPMFRRASLGVAAVQELISIYEDYLTDPAAHGLVLPENKTTIAKPAPLTHAGKLELEAPALLTSASTREMNLSEVLPPAPGMVRIALPTNAAITLEALADAVRRARSAA